MNAATHAAARRRGERGFSLLELLVVTVVLAIMLAILVPMASESIQRARARTMANQLALDLRAARWTAVSNRTPVDLTVNVDPGNAYEYTDSRGRVRKITMPSGVRIVSSTSPIRFLENGSVPGGSSTTIEARLGKDSISRWTISMTSLGISTTSHEQVRL